MNSKQALLGRHFEQNFQVHVLGSKKTVTRDFYVTLVGVRETSGKSSVHKEKLVSQMWDECQSYFLTNWWTFLIPFLANNFIDLTPCESKIILWLYFWHNFIFKFRVYSTNERVLHRVIIIIKRSHNIIPYWIFLGVFIEFGP